MNIIIINKLCHICKPLLYLNNGLVKEILRILYLEGGQKHSAEILKVIILLPGSINKGYRGNTKLVFINGLGKRRFFSIA